MEHYFHRNIPSILTHLVMLNSNNCMKVHMYGTFVAMFKSHAPSFLILLDTNVLHNTVFDLDNPAFKELAFAPCFSLAATRAYLLVFTN